MREVYRGFILAGLWQLRFRYLVSLCRPRRWEPVSGFSLQNAQFPAVEDEIGRFFGVVRTGKNLPLEPDCRGILQHRSVPGVE